MGQRRKVLRAGAVADDEDRVLLDRIAGHVEEPRAAPGRALPDPPALVGVERRRLGRQLAGQSARVRDERGDAARRDRPRSRWCTGSSGRRSRSRAPPLLASGGTPVAASCEAARHRLRVIRRRDVRLHQTAGRPALRGSVAAASDPSGAAGPPSTSSIACSWPRSGSKGSARVTGWPSASAPRRSRRGGAARGGPPRGAEMRRPARRTSAARRQPSGCPRRRRPGRTRAGHGSAAGRRRPSTPPRPTAGAPRPEQHPGQQGVQRPLARLQDVGMRRVQAEIAAAVLVVDAGRRVHDAGAEAHVVRFDQADRVALRIDGGEVDRPAARAGWSTAGGRAARRGSIRAASVRA